MPIITRPPNLTGQGVPSQPEIPQSKSKIVIGQHRIKLGAPPVKTSSPFEASLVDRIISKAKSCLSTLGKLFRELHHRIGAAITSIKASILSALSHPAASKVDSVSPVSREQKTDEEMVPAPVKTWHDVEKTVSKNIDNVSKLPQNQVLKRLFMLKQLKEDLELFVVEPADSSAKLQKMEEIDLLIKSIETETATSKHPLQAALEIAFAMPEERKKVMSITSTLQESADLSTLSIEELNEIESVVLDCGRKIETQPGSEANLSILANTKMLIHTVKEALFQNELNAAPQSTKRAFENIQKIFGEHFSIPVDIKLELIAETLPIWYVAQLLAQSNQDLDKLNFKGLSVLGTMITEVRKAVENDVLFKQKDDTTELREQLKTLGEYHQKIEKLKQIVVDQRLTEASPEIKNLFHRVQHIIGVNTPIPADIGYVLLDLFKAPEMLKEFNNFIDRIAKLKKENEARYLFQLAQNQDRSAQEYYIPYINFVVNAPQKVQELLNAFSAMLSLKVGANPVTQFITDGLELGEVSLDEALKITGPCSRSAKNILEMEFNNRMQFYDHMSPAEKALISQGFISMPGEVFIRNQWTGKGTGKPTLEFSVAALTKPPKTFDERSFSIEIDFESLTAFNLDHQTRREILYFIGNFEKAAKKIYNQNNSTFALNRIQSVRDRQLILNDEEFWKHVDNPEEFGPVDNNKKQLVLKRIGQLYEVATKFKDEMEPKFFTAMMELGSIDN